MIRVIKSYIDWFLPRLSLTFIWNLPLYLPLYSFRSWTERGQAWNSPIVTSCLTSKCVIYFGENTIIAFSFAMICHSSFLLPFSTSSSLLLLIYPFLSLFIFHANVLVGRVLQYCFMDTTLKKMYHCLFCRGLTYMDKALNCTAPLPRALLLDAQRVCRVWWVSIPVLCMHFCRAR